MSLMETVVGLGLLAIAAVMVGMGYKTLSKGNAEIGNTTEMQRVVKQMGTQIESDMKRAGFGLGGTGAFTSLQTSAVTLNYKDLLGASCAAGQVATIRYSVYNNSLIREAACDGKSLPKRVNEAGKDILSLKFRYLDNTGKPTSLSDKVRTVEYSVELLSGLPGQSEHKKRASAGSVSIVNNG